MDANLPVRSAQGARGFAGQYVTSQEVFDLESTKIFGCHWQCVARIEQLHVESRCLPIQVENQQLLLVQDDAGTLRAFRNFCRHRGSQLVNHENCGALGKRVQCPYHAWTYERSGQLVSAPNMADVNEFCLEDHGLREVACQTLAGFIWINFQPQQSLSDWLRPLADRFRDWDVESLRIARQIVYEVNANWKLIFQNYSECYHCPTVHPVLNRLTPFRASANDLTEGAILGGPMSLSQESQTMSNDGKFAGMLLPSLSAEQSRAVFYFTIFPTLFLSLHPDYVLVHRLERMSVSKTRIVCQFLFHPESISQSNFDPGQAIEFWDLTNRQDWRVCQLAQIGMSDPGYEPGPYSNLESVVAAFDRHYLSVLAAGPQGFSQS